MSSSLGIRPSGRIQRESATLYTSPLVAKTAKPAQNRQIYTKPRLFDGLLLRSGGSSQVYPLASLAHSWPSVPDGQPQVAESRGFGRNRPNTSIPVLLLRQ